MKKRVVPINEKDLFTLLNERQPFAVILSKKAQDALEGLGKNSYFIVWVLKMLNSGWNNCVCYGTRKRRNTNVERVCFFKRIYHIFFYHVNFFFM